MSSKLIDQYGNPLMVNAASLTEEIAAPTVGSVRSVWSETVLSGLDPISMAEVLRLAERGYPDRFFVLAEEMEERDLHYGSVLGTRKRAITGVEPLVVDASTSAQDKKIGDAVRAFVSQPEFIDDYLTDLLDALGKGYSVVETLWDRQAKEWRPRGYKWRDPRHFQIDQVDGQTLRLKHEDFGTDGMPLPPFKFSVHRPKLKSGLPIRGGLARLAAWAFLFKSYTLKDWMAFLEVYGMPLRVGKFGNGAKDSDKRVLLQAVREISTDAAAIIPKEMEIEFIEVNGSAGNGLFSSKAEYLDKQISKGILGQTMSTDDGSSMSQAMVHERVRHDIAHADARQTAVTANRDLIRPFVDLNFGPQEYYPTLVIPISEAEDIKALAEVISQLVPLGLEVSMTKVRERIGMPAPEDGEKIFYASAVPASEPNATAGQKPCSHCGGFHALAADSRDELDQLVETGLGHWQKDLGPMIEPIRKLFERAQSYEDLETGLDDLVAKVDAGPLADRLAKLAMIARGLGDTGQA